MLPKDPEMLYSSLNMKLRDFYSSLDDLCDGEDCDKEEIADILASAGYRYDEKSNRIVSR